MEKDRQYRLIFNDGFVLVDASFLEDRSKIIKGMKDIFSKNPEDFDLTHFSILDWKSYCSGISRPELFQLIDYLHLTDSGLIGTITDKLSEEEIWQRVHQMSFKELASYIPLLTGLPQEYGQKTLEIVLDLLGRADEIFEANNSYLPLSLPNNFQERLQVFLGGVRWEPSPGVILSGGALMTLLSDRDLSNLDVSEDLDLWVYGDDEETRKKVQRDLILSLVQNKEVKGVWDARCRKITLKYADSSRTIQVIRTEYRVPSQIPNFFDMDHIKGYLSTEGLFLHPKFIRALRLNHVDLDFETIKVHRIIKCLRYDYMMSTGIPLWQEILNFLKADLSRLGRVRHLPTTHNLGRVRGQLNQEITCKEELVSFLRGFIVPPDDEEEIRGGDLDLPENFQWQRNIVVKDVYPYSIREKALIIALDDPVSMHEVLLKETRGITFEGGRNIFRTEERVVLYPISLPIVLRFHNLIIRKGNSQYYASFDCSTVSQGADNRHSPFLSQMSQILSSKCGHFMMRLLLNRCQYDNLSLHMNLLDKTGLSNRMRVDLDLQIEGIIYVNLSFIKCNVIYMNVLDHLN